MFSQPQISSIKLPVALCGLILTSFTALYWIKFSSWTLFLFAGLILLSYVVIWRIETILSLWMGRICIMILVLIVTITQRSIITEGLLNSQWISGLALLCAGELVIQVWNRHPRQALLLSLPCIIMIAVGNTFEQQQIKYVAPLFILFIMLSLPLYRQRYTHRKLSFVGILLLIAALLIGLGLNATVNHYREALNSLGGDLEENSPAAAWQRFDPILGERFDLQDSPRQVMRVDGVLGEIYLRALAYSTYSNGHWLPGVKARPYEIPSRHDMQKPVVGPCITITTLVPINDTIFTPLNAARLYLSTPLWWSKQQGGPLRSRGVEVSSYDIVLDNRNKQTIWATMTKEQRALLLTIPNSIDVRVQQLAQKIGQGKRTPLSKIMAVTAYLTKYHQYSLRVNPGQGDPVSSFLLHRLSGHCEYFASSATILLRCLGVPTRYVVGYYGHELDERSMLIRQRDAHAWAESWIDGQGWVTVEATPSSARPDNNNAYLPSHWMQINERVNSIGWVLRNWLVELSTLETLGLLALFILPFQAVKIWQKWRQRPKPTVATPYSELDIELREIADHFTAWLENQGHPCPASCPWQIHIRRIHAMPAALVFVQAYNRIRFGTIYCSEDVKRVANLLTELEQRTSVEERTDH